MRYKQNPIKALIFSILSGVLHASTIGERSASATSAEVATESSSVTISPSLRLAKKIQNLILTFLPLREKIHCIRASSNMYALSQDSMQSCTELFDRGFRKHEVDYLVRIGSRTGFDRLKSANPLSVLLSDLSQILQHLCTYVENADLPDDHKTAIIGSINTIKSHRLETRHISLGLDKEPPTVWISDLTDLIDSGDRNKPYVFYYFQNRPYWQEFEIVLQLHHFPENSHSPLDRQLFRVFVNRPYDGSFWCYLTEKSLGPKDYKLLGKLELPENLILDTELWREFTRIFNLKRQYRQNRRHKAR